MFRYIWSITLLRFWWTNPRYSKKLSRRNFIPPIKNLSNKQIYKGIIKQHLQNVSIKYPTHNLSGDFLLDDKKVNVTDPQLKKLYLLLHADRGILFQNRNKMRMYRPI